MQANAFIITVGSQTLIARIEKEHNQNIYRKPADFLSFSSHEIFLLFKKAKKP